MVIEKKVRRDFFEKVLSSEKKHEIRINDFEVKRGDVLFLREWNPETKSYIGRSVRKKVGFVTKTKKLKYWSEEDVNKSGFVVMDLE